MKFTKPPTLALILGILFSSISVADSVNTITYVSKTIRSPKGSMPACTPLWPEVKGKKVILKDPNDVWGKVRLAQAQFDALPLHEGFDQCVSEVPAYEGRYNEEHLLALSKGELAATMPFEFALMILGPSKGSPTIMSMVNPLTGKPETTKTYVWLNMFGKVGTLRTIFSLIGGAALGVAATTSSLDTAVDALTVANAATTAELITWRVSDFSQAKFVTIQVNSENQIQLLMAQ